MAFIFFANWSYIAETLRDGQLTQWVIASLHNKELAEKIAQSFTDEMVEFKPTHTDEEVKEQLQKLMSAKLPQRQADVLESAVRDEKQRRAAAEGKTPTNKDRLDEAVNLYAICENKRLVASQSEVEKLTKAALKTKLEQVGFVVAEGE